MCEYVCSILLLYQAREMFPDAESSEFFKCEVSVVQLFSVLYFADLSASQKGQNSGLVFCRLML